MHVYNTYLYEARGSLCFEVVNKRGSRCLVDAREHKRLEGRARSNKTLQDEGQVLAESNQKPVETNL